MGGSISLSINTDLQCEESEVRVQSSGSEHPLLMPTISHDSWNGEDTSPLVSITGLHSAGANQNDHIIPVVVKDTGGVAPPSPLPSYPLFERQVSEPLPPSMIRQVLHGSTSQLRRDHMTSLHRQNSLMAKMSHDKDHDHMTKDTFASTGVLSKPLPQSK